MDVQTPGAGKRYGAMSSEVTSNDTGTSHQPTRHVLRAALLIPLPLFAISALLATALVYKTLNTEAIKNFRICVFLRFLAVVDGLMIVVTLGLPWVGLLLPPDYTWGTFLTDHVCSLYIFSKLSLGDVGIYVLVMAGLERLYTRLEKPWYSLDAIFFTSHHHVRVTCIFARLMLLFWVDIIVVLNLILLHENWFESSGVTNLGQCLTTWRIVGDKNNNFTEGQMHSLLGAVLAACILIIGEFLKCSNRSTQCLAIQQPEKPIQEARVPHFNVSSLPVETLPSNERSTPSMESVHQNATQDTLASDDLTPKFFRVYRTIQVCNWRGYTLGMCLVPCDNKAIPTRSQEHQFDCMVLAYTFLYLIFEIPQIVMRSMGGPIAKHYGLAFVRDLDMIADILSGNRPALVLCAYALVSLRLITDSLVEILGKAFFCTRTCLPARTNVEN